MTNSIKNIFLVSLIFLIISLPMLYWGSLQGDWVTTSEIEGRKLSVFPKNPFQNQKTGLKRLVQGYYIEAFNLFFKDLTNGSLQNQLNEAIADQFPLRINMTEFAYNVENALITSAYSLFTDNALPASTHTTILVSRDRSRLFIPPTNFNDSKKLDINFRIQNYIEISKNNPDINLYVFNVETLRYSKFNPVANLYIKADNGSSLAYFLENKPDTLRFNNLEISSYQEFENNFFRTDHHWNIHGALKAYRMIYEMLARNYKDISPMLETGRIQTLDGVNFLGSYARESLSPISPEPFEYLDIQLPEYSTFVNGKLETYGARDQYLSGNFSKEKYFSHYEGFYGSWKKLIIYEFDNTSDRNLLLISSSHARMNQMLIASHYKKTYVLDLRRQDAKAISIKKLVSDYQIDDVLFMGQPEVTYLSKAYAVSP